MGTTITAALVADAAVSFGHVGDSRAYLWRDGVLQQLSDDHSLVGELVRRGALTPEEAERHPQKNIITRTVGTEPALAVDTWTLEAAQDDVFLLASDGLNNMSATRRSRGSLARRRRSRTPRASWCAPRTRPAASTTSRRCCSASATARPPRPPSCRPRRTLLPDMVYADEPPPKRRRKGVRRLLFVLSALVVSAALALGGLALLRESHFVGADSRRSESRSTRACRTTWSATSALPRIRSSPIPCRPLTPAERAALFDHKLLSLDDAQARIDRLPAAVYYGRNS